MGRFDREAKAAAAALRRQAERAIANRATRNRPGTVQFVDKTRRRAQVLIDGETANVELDWRGAIDPAPGDQVDVIIEPGGQMRLGSAARITPPDITPTIPPPPPNLNSSYLTECWLWGHSYVGQNISQLSTYGWDPEMGHPFTIDDYLFNGLGLGWPGTRALGQLGAQLYGFVGAKAMNYGKVGGAPAMGLVHPYNQGVGPYPARHGAHALILGTNDLAMQGDPAMEGKRAITQWKHSVQSMTAWLSLGAYFPAYQLYSAGAPEGGTETASKYAGCTYTGAWARTPPAGATKSQGNGGLDFFNATFYPADGYQQTTASGATATIRVPADHPGTNVWLFFIGEIGQTGAPGVAISWTGGAALLSTNDVVRTPQVASNALTGTNVPAYAMCTVAVPLARTGAVQTITVNAGTLAANHKLRFCGWGIAAPDPKLVTWGTIPIPKIWHGDTVGGPANMKWPAHPDPSGHASQGGAQPVDRGGAGVGAEQGDTWATVYDAATAEVASRFPAHVVVARLSAFNGLSAKYLFRDRIHPTREGNRVLAHALIDGMNLTPLPVSNLASTSSGHDLASLVLGVPA